MLETDEKEPEILDGPTAASNGFDAGNYANAYEGSDLSEALEYHGLDDRPETDTYRAAFILGFFSSYELHEIGDREEYDAAYFSDAGQHVIASGYCDDRTEEYAAEEQELSQ
jgi:hypothetical protein